MKNVCTNITLYKELLGWIEEYKNAAEEWDLAYAECNGREENMEDYDIAYEQTKDEINSLIHKAIKEGSTTYTAEELWKWVNKRAFGWED